MAARTSNTITAAPVTAVAAPSRRAKIAAPAVADTGVGVQGMNEEQKKLFRAKSIQCKRHNLDNAAANAAARAHVLFGTPLPFDTAVAAVAVVKAAQVKAVAAPKTVSPKAPVAVKTPSPKAPAAPKAPVTAVATVPARKRSSAVAAPVTAPTAPKVASKSRKTGDVWIVTNPRTLETFETSVEPARG